MAGFLDFLVDNAEGVGVDHVKGSAFFRVKRAARNGIPKAIFDLGSTGSNQGLIQCRLTDDTRLNTAFYDNAAQVGSLSVTPATGLPDVGQYMDVYIEWDGASIAMQVEDGTVVSGTRSAFLYPYSAPVYLGSNRSGTLQWEEQVVAGAFFDGHGLVLWGM